MRKLNIKGLRGIFLITGSLLLLVALLLTLMPGKDPKPVDAVNDPSEANSRDSLALFPKSSSSSEPKAAAANTKSLADSNQTSVKADHSPIEAILKDQASSFEDKATNLLECARQEDLPMEVRLSALDHAFNLDRWQTLTLCMEKPLPAPIAGRLLSGIHNINESPKDQVSACMHLIEHEDAEIREQAQGLLAFLVSAEEHALEPDKLREVANAFLGKADERSEEITGQ